MLREQKVQIFHEQLWELVELFWLVVLALEVATWILSTRIEQTYEDSFCKESVYHYHPCHFFSLLVLICAIFLSCHPLGHQPKSNCNLMMLVTSSVSLSLTQLSWFREMYFVSWVLWQMYCHSFSYHIYFWKVHHYLRLNCICLISLFNTQIFPLKRDLLNGLLNIVISRHFPCLWNLL